MVSSVDVAQTLIDLAKQDGRELKPMELQSLVFLAHGWSHVLLDKPLIEGEDAEAWKKEYDEEEK